MKITLNYEDTKLNNEFIVDESSEYPKDERILSIDVEHEGKKYKEYINLDLDDIKNILIIKTDNSKLGEKYYENNSTFCNKKI